MARQLKYIQLVLKVQSVTDGDVTEASLSVTTRAQPPRTDVPQPRTDLSHGARTDRKSVV